MLGRTEANDVIQLIIGAVFLLVGLPFLVRGWIFTLKPAHAVSLKAKERNMRMGLETDMKAWGRRVRRFGTILVAIGIGLSVWGVSTLQS
jgi:hypothetical protein